jgi:hypothetical protein
MEAGSRLLLATWNIANLGVHQRRDRDHRLLAEMIGWFDLVAIQEVNDDLAGLRAVVAHLPNDYHVVFSDAAGNNERLAFVFDTRKVTLLEKVGEIAIPPRRSPPTTTTTRSLSSPARPLTPPPATAASSITTGRSSPPCGTAAAAQTS